MKDDEAVLDDWQKFIEEDAIAQELDPGEMTPAMYAELTHLSTGAANARLKRRWQAGDLTRRRYGCHSYAYRPAKKVKK